ncbi:hypothetical protein ACFSKM_14045 [Ancylobacter dichloromethanicus]
MERPHHAARRLPSPAQAARGGIAAMVLFYAVLLVAPAAAEDSRLDAAIGKALFERPWVPAPSSTRANDGLGPLFDARSCSACHPGGAGRGATALDAEGRPEGLGLVLSLFRSDGAGDPVYGHRLETMTLPGVPAEGAIAVAVEDGRRTPGLPLPATARSTPRRICRFAPPPICAGAASWNRWTTRRSSRWRTPTTATATGCAAAPTG